MTRAKILWRTPSVLFPLVAAGALAYACADPKGDLDDYITRSDEASNAPKAGAGGSGSGGASGGAPLAPGLYDLSGKFVFACTTEATKSLGQALRFVADVQMTVEGAAGEGGGTGGTLTMSLQPLTISAKTVNENAGPPVPTDGPSTVDAKGEFVFTYTKVEIDGSASPLGRAITLENAAFKASSQNADFFCVRFRGQVTQPLATPLVYESQLNTCLSARVGDDGVLPPLSDSQLTACKDATVALPAPP